MSAIQQTLKLKKHRTPNPKVPNMNINIHSRNEAGQKAGEVADARLKSVTEACDALMVEVYLGFCQEKPRKWASKSPDSN